MFNKFQKRKWNVLWNMAEIEITEGYANFSNSGNKDKS